MTNLSRGSYAPDGNSTQEKTSRERGIGQMTRVATSPERRHLTSPTCVRSHPPTRFSACRETVSVFTTEVGQRQFVTCIRCGPPNSVSAKTLDHFSPTHRTHSPHTSPTRCGLKIALGPSVPTCGHSFVMSALPQWHCRCHGLPIPTQIVALLGLDLRKTPIIGYIETKNARLQPPPATSPTSVQTSPSHDQPPSSVLRALLAKPLRRDNSLPPSHLPNQRGVQKNH